ncbi:MAG TPA: hypothetical protein VMS17_17020 [Gemmataceae bacterium]|nr:hypothetical protein [Gemmataceae bacterium]
MVSAHQPDEGTAQRSIRLHHGTDQSSANDLLQSGVNQQQAAAWNGSGEFWATSDHRRAEWFALSHPASPPAACFEFDLVESALLLILQLKPPGAIHHAPDDFEFLPGSYALLNQHMSNKRIAPVP